MTVHVRGMTKLRLTLRLTLASTLVLTGTLLAWFAAIYLFLVMLSGLGVVDPLRFHLAGTFGSLLTLAAVLLGSEQWRTMRRRIQRHAIKHGTAI